VVSCRRGGNSASFEQLNQFFGISGMPTAPSTYWNDVHGFGANDVLADEEGVQTMRNLARNMSFLIRAIAAEKEKNGLPEDAEKDAEDDIQRTHDKFIKKIDELFAAKEKEIMTV
jgi:multimeric flavodoxin WrbA